MSATNPVRRLHMLLRPAATSASNFFLNKSSFNGKFTSVVGLSSYHHKIDLQQYVSWSTSTRRNYSTKRNDVVDVKEVIIPVPWGHIAARHWNGSDPSRKPTLCLHGWKDNAASFDALFPLLVPELPQYQFLAIDLPGHGKSSHFPPGMIYSVQDMWVAIRRILKHFDWKKISIISHSMGSQISFSYAGTHPEVVEKLVTIDALSPLVLSREETISMIPKLTSDILKFEEKLATGTRPYYSYDDIVAKLVKTHVGGLDAASCKKLMTRGVEEHPPGSGKYQFTHDIRVHYMPVTGISSRQVSFIARNFKSDILHIKATKGVNYTRPYIKTRIEDWLAHGEDGKSKGNLVRFVDVEGNHHLHLINPVSVLPYIVRFMDHEKHHVKHHLRQKELHAAHDNNY